MSTEAYKNRSAVRFQSTLEYLFDENTTKILDELIRESRKEIFESKDELKSDSTILK